MSDPSEIIPSSLEYFEKKKQATFLHVYSAVNIITGCAIIIKTEPLPWKTPILVGNTDSVIPGTWFVRNEIT